MKSAARDICEIFANALTYIVLALLGSTAKALSRHKGEFRWPEYLIGSFLCIVLAICMSELFQHFDIPYHLGNAIMILAGFSASDVIRELSRKTVLWIGKIGG